MQQPAEYNPAFITWLADLAERHKWALLDADPGWQQHLDEMHQADIEQASYDRGEYAPPPRE